MMRMQIANAKNNDFLQMCRRMECGVSNYMQEHFVQREVGYYCVIGV